VTEERKKLERNQTQFSSDKATLSGFIPLAVSLVKIDVIQNIFSSSFCVKIGIRYASTCWL